MGVTKRPRFLGGERAAIRSDRDRRRAWKALDHAVRAAEHSAPDNGTLELQLVARVAGSASYTTLKTTHGEAWRRQRLPYSVDAWPPMIDEGDLAVVLLPLSAGRIGLSVGKQPRPLATPFFATGRPIRPGDHEDVVLVAILSWLEHARAGRAVRLAPPVVELMQRGAATDRRVLEFGRTWTLPRADGI